MAKLGKTSMKKCFKFFVRTFSLESGEVEVQFSVYIPGVQGDRDKNKPNFLSNYWNVSMMTETVEAFFTKYI